MNLQQELWNDMHGSRECSDGGTDFAIDLKRFFQTLTSDQKICMEYVVIGYKGKEIASFMGWTMAETTKTMDTIQDRYQRWMKIK